MGVVGWPDWLLRLIWQEQVELAEEPGEPVFALKHRRSEPETAAVSEQAELPQPLMQALRPPRRLSKRP
jgi:hypothetical protein